jgi:uncharacterized membrane protein YraQ (UPF0718 family)
MPVMASNGSARVFELLATIVRVVCSVIAAVLVVYAIFVFFGANPENGLVTFARGWRETFGWFTIDLFTPADPAIRETVNTALAAVVWVVAGTLLSKLIVRLAPSGKAKAEKKA